MDRNARLQGRLEAEVLRMPDEGQDLVQSNLNRNYYRLKARAGGASSAERKDGGFRWGKLTAGVSNKECGPPGNCRASASAGECIVGDCRAIN